MLMEKYSDYSDIHKIKKFASEGRKCNYHNIRVDIILLSGPG